MSDKTCTKNKKANDKQIIAEIKQNSKRNKIQVSGKGYGMVQKVFLLIFNWKKRRNDI